MSIIDTNVIRALEFDSGRCRHQGVYVCAKSEPIVLEKRIDFRVGV